MNRFFNFTTIVLFALGTLCLFVISEDPVLLIGSKAVAAVLFYTGYKINEETEKEETENK